MICSILQVCRLLSALDLQLSSQPLNLAMFLQGERLAKIAIQGNEKTEVAGNRGRIIFQLEKIGKDLGVDFETEESPDEISITGAIRDRLSIIIGQFDQSMIKNPPAILEIDETEFTPNQLTLFESIRVAFNNVRYFSLIGLYAS